MLQRYEWRVTPKDKEIGEIFDYLDRAASGIDIATINTVSLVYPAPESYQGRAPRALEQTLRRFQPARKK